MTMTHSFGNNAGNFIRRVPSIEQVDVTRNQSQRVIEGTKPELPKFHTRAMRTEMFKNLVVSPGIEPVLQ